MSRAWPVAVASAAGACAALAHAAEYTYVRMSLGVPWTLYFVFLACVSIPFVVMVALAWRRRAEPEDRDAERNDDAAADDAR